MAASAAHELPDNSKVDMLGAWYTYVKFGAEKGPGSPKLPDSSDVQRFPGGLVFKAHRLLDHSTLDLRVIKKKSASTNRETEKGNVVPL